MRESIRDLGRLQHIVENIDRVEEFVNQESLDEHRRLREAALYTSRRNMESFIAKNDVPDETGETGALERRGKGGTNKLRFVMNLNFS